MNIKKNNESSHKKSSSDDRLFSDMKDNISKVLAWKMPNINDKNLENNYLDEYSHIQQRINSLNKQKLSPLDMKFLKAMASYYYIVAQKPEMNPELYKEYLRSARDEVGEFYLAAALGNGYTLKKNPLRIPLSELFSVCTFMNKEFIHEDGYLDRDDYLTAYETGKPLTFIELLREAKKTIPDFKKENIDISLLFKIFDLDNEASKNVLDYILHKELGYTQAEILDIHKKYKLY